MACSLVGMEPLSEPMLEFDPKEQIQWNINQNLYIFIQENTFENVVCEMFAILPRPSCVKEFLK